MKVWLSISKNSQVYKFNTKHQCLASFFILIKQVTKFLGFAKWSNGLVVPAKLISQKASSNQYTLPRISQEVEEVQ